jgi:hypothetical protein
MTIKWLEELPADEVQDFGSACAKRGMVGADFEVCADEAYPVNGIGHIRRIAFVKRKGRPEGKEYPAGSGTSWTAAFEVDLLAGVFG